MAMSQRVYEILSLLQPALIVATLITVGATIESIRRDGWRKSVPRIYISVSLAALLLVAHLYLNMDTEWRYEYYMNH